MKETEFKFNKLEEQLKRICLKENISAIGGFTFMFDEADGRTIMYAKDMPIEYIGEMREFYDRNSISFDSKFDDILWPYTGFIQGNILGWNPISITQLRGWFENSPYKIEDFIEHFRNKPRTYKKWKKKI